jgi:hypothetical protein
MSARDEKMDTKKANERFKAKGGLRSVEDGQVEAQNGHARQ